MSTMRLTVQPTDVTQPKCHVALVRVAAAFDAFRSAPASSVRAAWTSDEHSVSDLSHELRGPLRVLDLRLQQFAHKVPVTGETARELDQIRADVRGLFDVVNDVLLLSRIDSSDVARRSDAYSVAGDVIQAMSIVEAAAGMELIVNGDRAAVAEISPSSLRRCLMALVDNAIKHTPGGGRVTAIVAKTKRHVVIDVADSGPGVDLAVITRLFERNVYSEPASVDRPSFGIGLALVHETAVRNGGTASILETGPSGTTIRLTLPKAS